MVAKVTRKHVTGTSAVTVSVGHLELTLLTGIYDRKSLTRVSLDGFKSLVCAVIIYVQQLITIFFFFFPNLHSKISPYWRAFSH